MEACKCAGGLANTGVPGCPTVMSYAEMLIAVPKFASDGSLNFIDLTDPLSTQAFWDALINAADSADRHFPLPRIKNAESTRGDAQFEDFADGSQVFIHQGKRPFSFLIAKQGPELLGQLEAWRCTQFGVFIVDRSGNLRGSLKEKGKLFPIGVDNTSWVPQLVFGTASTIEKIAISFNFDINEQDSDLRQINASELTPVNVLRLEGLKDVFASHSAISTTGFTTKLFLKYGSALNPIPLPGLVSADFKGNTNVASKVFNKTTSLDVAITSVVENPDGTYTFVIPAQTSGDEIVVKAVKNGYDFKPATETVVVIP